MRAWCVGVVDCLFVTTCVLAYMHVWLFVCLFDWVLDFFCASVCLLVRLCVCFMVYVVCLFACSVDRSFVWFGCGLCLLACVYILTCLLNMVCAWLLVLFRCMYVCVMCLACMLVRLVVWFVRVCGLLGLGVCLVVLLFAHLFFLLGERVRLLACLFVCCVVAVCAPVC